MLRRSETRENHESKDRKAEEEDWVVARRAIHLVLNNKYAEAQQLFHNRKESLQLAVGHCYIVFMNAVMTFEEEVLEEATTVLHELEKRCAQDLGWLKTMRNKVFGSSKDKSEAASLEEQIILADCQVCSALLSLVGCDSKAGLVRGGWALRKAWRLYNHTYAVLLHRYRLAFGLDARVPGSEVPSWRVIQRGGITPDSPSCPWTLPPTPVTTPTNGYRLNPFAGFFSPSTPEPPPSPLMDRNEVARLMSAISFGYGLFHLCVSLLPATLLRFVQLLGFAGDRMTGLEALMFARQGPDMRAPLATLALLWYHTIVRPFFALDGHNVQAGAEAASILVEESKHEFGESALFLFFSGKLHRLKNDINRAVETYSKAVELSGQREMQLLCLHEVAWCRLIQLDLRLAYSAFLQLKHTAAWGKIFYTYLAVLCAGALGDEEVVGNLAPKLPAWTAEDALSILMKRRASRMSSEKRPHFFRLLIYELLYLWNDLPSSDVDAIIHDCESGSGSEEEPMVGLRRLVVGACQALSGKRDLALISLHSAIQQRISLPPGTDDHISAFAEYEMALLLLKEPQTAEDGRKLLVHAQTCYKDYDCENRLSIRIHLAMRQANIA